MIVRPQIGGLTFGRVMDRISSYPSQAYDYVNGNYGTVGLIVAGVLIVVAVISIMVWFDRRK
jgi:hypothetical protein